MLSCRAEKPSPEMVRQFKGESIMARLFTGSVLAILGLTVFLGWGAVRVVKDIQFDRAAGGYLKRAADANTVDLAEKELARVIGHIEKMGMTTGYTSVLWITPDEDLGFWYQNLKASLQELQSVPPGATQLEKSNVLIKLRETLLDQGDKSTKVTVPEGISIFPYNTLYFWWGWLSFLLGILFLLFAVSG